MQHRDPGKLETPSFRETYNLVTYFFLSWATCYWPFLRRDFGVQAFGVPAAFGLLILLVYAAVQHSGAMFLYLVIWLLLVAWHRTKAVRNERRGELVEHSRYDG